VGTEAAVQLTDTLVVAVVVWVQQVEVRLAELLVLVVLVFLIVLLVAQLLIAVVVLVEVTTEHQTQPQTWVTVEVMRLVMLVQAVAV
jgi:uncharacterized membrane protein